MLVTGAARRLGREIVFDLARHGFDVALHYRASADDAAETVAKARAFRAQAWAFCADLSDEAACRALVPAVVAQFGRLDAIVNNASTFEYDNVASFSYAAMELHWRANTAPAIVLAQALHSHLEARAVGQPDCSGCVVNLLDQKLWNLNPDYLSYTLSKAALEAATTLLAQALHTAGGQVVVNLLDQKLWNLNPDHLSYTLSKAALEAATKVLAMALAPRVRVCGVAPGLTLTSPEMNEAEFERAFRLTPLTRGSTPLDVARAVRFAIESPAITGTTLLVDGGQHLMAQARDVSVLAKDTTTPLPLEPRR